MKRVDKLLDQMPEPVEQLMDMSRADQNALVIAAVSDMHSDDPVALAEIFERAFGVQDDDFIEYWLDHVGGDDIDQAEKDYTIDQIFVAIESVINDRIDLYNAS